MSDFKISTPQGTMRINQGINDIKHGIQQNDPSRISVYNGPNSGVHTGNDSPTIGRHGEPFGK